MEQNIIDLHSFGDRSSEYLDLPDDDTSTMKTTVHLSEERTCLWRYLNATGIQVFEPNITTSCLSTVLRLWYPFILHVALLVNTVMLVLQCFHGAWDLKILLACTSFNILAIGVWHCFRCKRKALLRLLLALHEAGKRYGDFEVTSLQVLVTNLSVLLYSVTPTVFSLVCVYYASGDNSIDKFWTFGYHVDRFGALGKVLLFFNVNLYVWLQVVFPGLTACIYCALCHRLTLLLSCCLRKLTQDHREMTSKQMASAFLTLLKVLDLHQDTFSAPLFILVVMHLLHMFSLLAYFLTFSKEQFSAVVVAEWVLILMTSASSLVAINIYAPRVSSRVQGVRDWFRRRLEKAVLQGAGRDEALVVAAEREVVVLSACDVFHFRKSFIFSVLGVLLTYSLLILQIQK